MDICKGEKLGFPLFQFLACMLFDTKNKVATSTLLIQAQQDNRGLNFTCVTRSLIQINSFDSGYNFLDFKLGLNYDTFW